MTNKCEKAERFLMLISVYEVIRFTANDYAISNAERSTSELNESNEDYNRNFRCVRRFPSGSVRGIRGRPRLFWVP